MTRKLVSTIFYVVFGLVFATMLGIMIVGFIKQNEDEKNQIARYESMIGQGGKTTLTNEILEEDHEKYLADSAKAKSTFITLLTLFGSIIVLFVIMGIFTTVLKGIEDSGRGSTGFIVTLASFLVILFIFGSFVVVTMRVIIPKMNASDPTGEKYSWGELHISDTLREEEIVETGSGDSRSTETRVSYYLIDEDGKKIGVSKLYYDRYTGPGIYYAGQTIGGNIFSPYPGEYFELQQ